MRKGGAFSFIYSHRFMFLFPWQYCRDWNQAIRPAASPSCLPGVLAAFQGAFSYRISGGLIYRIPNNLRLRVSNGPITTNAIDNILMVCTYTALTYTCIVYTRASYELAYEHPICIIAAQDVVLTLSIRQEEIPGPRKICNLRSIYWQFFTLVAPHIAAYRAYRHLYSTLIN